MLNVIQSVNIVAFFFMAYLLAGVLSESLKNSKLLKPIAMTICSITIAIHLHQTGAWAYIIASFVGYFAHTCVDGYVKKVKVPTVNKGKKVVNINP